MFSYFVVDIVLCGCLDVVVVVVVLTLLICVAFFLFVQIVRDVCSNSFPNKQLCCQLYEKNMYLHVYMCTP